MPDRPELSQFEPHVGDDFAVQSPDGPALALTLTEASRGPWQPEGKDAFAFELIFRGPREPLLPQAIYRMTHDALGGLDIFIVPIEQSGGGVTYQAVFS